MEEGVREKLADGKPGLGGSDLDRSGGDVDGCEDEVDHDDAPEVHHGHIELVRALRSIAKRQNKTGQ